MERKDLIDKGRREMVNIRQVEKMAGGGTPLRKLIKTFEAATQPYKVDYRGNRVVIVTEGNEFEFDAKSGNFIGHRDKLAAFRVSSKKAKR